MAKNNRLYSPTCQVCQYMRRNRDFSVALLLSSYFNPKGQESLPEVNKRFGEPFTQITLYKHAQRHMKPNVPRWMKINGLEEKKNWHTALEKTRVATAEKLEVLENTMELVERTPESISAHEQTLDDFITKGHEMIRDGQLKVTAQTLVQAIKAKADIEKSNKDRRFNALREMFAGAAPKNKDL